MALLSGTALAIAVYTMAAENKERADSEAERKQNDVIWRKAMEEAFKREQEKQGKLKDGKWCGGKEPPPFSDTLEHSIYSLVQLSIRRLRDRHEEALKRSSSFLQTPTIGSDVSALWMELAALYIWGDLKTLLRYVNQVDFSLCGLDKFGFSISKMSKRDAARIIEWLRGLAKGHVTSDNLNEAEVKMLYANLLKIVLRGGARGAFISTACDECAKVHYRELGLAVRDMNFCMFLVDTRDLQTAKPGQCLDILVVPHLPGWRIGQFRHTSIDIKFKEGEFLVANFELSQTFKLVNGLVKQDGNWLFSLDACVVQNHKGNLISNADLAMAAEKSIATLYVSRRATLLLERINMSILTGSGLVHCQVIAAEEQIFDSQLPQILANQEAYNFFANSDKILEQIGKGLLKFVPEKEGAGLRGLQREVENFLESYFLVLTLKLQSVSLNDSNQKPSDLLLQNKFKSISFAAGKDLWQFTSTTHVSLKRKVKEWERGKTQQLIKTARRAMPTSWPLCFATIAFALLISTSCLTYDILRFSFLPWLDTHVMHICGDLPSINFVYAIFTQLCCVLGSIAATYGFALFAVNHLGELSAADLWRIIVNLDYDVYKEKLLWPACDLTFMFLAITYDKRFRPEDLQKQECVEAEQICEAQLRIWGGRVLNKILKKRNKQKSISCIEVLVIMDQIEAIAEDVNVVQSGDTQTTTGKISTTTLDADLLERFKALPLSDEEEEDKGDPCFAGNNKEKEEEDEEDEDEVASGDVRSFFASISESVECTIREPEASSAPLLIKNANTQWEYQICEAAAEIKTQETRHEKKMKKYAKNDERRKKNALSAAAPAAAAHDVFVPKNEEDGNQEAEAKEDELRLLSRKPRKASTVNNLLEENGWVLERIGKHFIFKRVVKIAPAKGSGGEGGDARVTTDLVWRKQTYVKSSTPSTSNFIKKATGEINRLNEGVVAVKAAGGKVVYKSIN